MGKWDKYTAPPQGWTEQEARDAGAGLADLGFRLPSRDTTASFVQPPPDPRGEIAPLPPAWLRFLRRRNEELPMYAGAAGALAGAGGGSVLFPGAGTLVGAAEGTAAATPAGVGMRELFRHILYPGYRGTASKLANDMLFETALNEANTLLGEGLGAGARAWGRSAMTSALYPREAIRNRARDVASQQVRERLSPEQVNLAGQALSERVGIGRSFLHPDEIGSRTLGREAAGLAADRTASVAARRGNATVFDITGHPEFPALRDELAKRTNGADMTALYDKELRKLVESGSAPGVGNARGKLQKWTIAELEKRKEEWQRQADWAGAYARKNGQSVSVRGRIAEIAARAARELLEPIPNVGASAGQYPTVGALNARLQSLGPLEAAYIAAENRLPPRLRGFNLTMTPLVRLAENPRVQSRLALGLTNPKAQAAAVQIPPRGLTFAIRNLLTNPEDDTYLER